jgi:formylglycine-generating enzyme required for sulfatase activity
LAVSLSLSCFSQSFISSAQLGAASLQGTAVSMAAQNSVPANMVLVPAGTFLMGDSLDGLSDAGTNSPYVSAFYMDQNLVTLPLWQTVYSWAITNGYSFDYAGSGKAANHPVQTIDWYDCVKWCNARSEKEGRVPAYYTTSAQTTVYRTGQVSVTNSAVNWNAGYRLPTEAEWEKAARGGLIGQRFPWGNTISESQANYNGNTSYAYDLGPNGYNAIGLVGGSPYTSPVGSFQPNGYGLYDMAGNVWQWCWDWYGTYAGGTDPRGVTSGPYRVLRGGSWILDADYCRSAYRYYSYPTLSYGNIGFRSVLPPGQP